MATRFGLVHDLAATAGMLIDAYIRESPVWETIRQRKAKP